MAKKKVHDRLRAVFHESWDHALNNLAPQGADSQVARYIFFAPLFLQLGKIFFPLFAGSGSPHWLKSNLALKIRHESF